MKDILMELRELKWGCCGKFSIDRYSKFNRNWLSDWKDKPLSVFFFFLRLKPMTALEINL